MRSRVLLLFLLIVIFSGCSHFHQDLKAAKERAPKDMAYIPAGWFDMGSIEGQGRLGMAIGVDEIPRHKVYVDDFYMDIYEVTNTQFYDFLIEAKDSYRPSHWEVRESLTNEEESHPVVDVDWLDADAYCRWYGKRLPTEMEWEKAARGTDGRLWPWGNEYNGAKANTAEAGLAWTSPVGSFPEDVSPYGIFDMAGNVREWVNGWYDIYPGNQVSLGHYNGPYRVLRGGSYETMIYRYPRTASRHAIASTLATRGHNWHSNFDHGFRCAKTP